MFLSQLHMHVVLPGAYYCCTHTRGMPAECLNNLHDVTFLKAHKARSKMAIANDASSAQVSPLSSQSFTRGEARGSGL